MCDCSFAQVLPKLLVVLLAFSNYHSFFPDFYDCNHFEKVDQEKGKELRELSEFNLSYDIIAVVDAL